MGITRQRGQSMTEYLVVLGVTGLTLLAATTDVGELFDNVHRSYTAQSSEMSKVQLYKSQKVRFNENPSGNDDFDDGDTLPPHTPELPDADEQLPYIEWVHDSDGNLLGKMSGDTLLDDDGNIIAWCERTVTGDCVFKDEKGNLIFIGATGNRQWVDEDGNELPLVALTSGGQVYGFAYQYKDKLYSAHDRKLLNPQPTSFKPEPMRRILSYDAQGVAQTEGYELDGAFYSHQATLAPPDFDEAIGTEAKELVTVINPPATDQWQGYPPCLVMPRGWRNSLGNPLEDPESNRLTGVWEEKFNDPSLRLASGGVGGFINAIEGECGGASTVIRDPATGSWTLM